MTKRLKIFAFSAMILLALSVTVFFVRYAFRNAERTELFNQALEVFRSGDRLKAEEALRKALAADPDNEVLFVKLAENNAALKRWAFAAAYYRQAAALNPFQKEYIHQRIQALEFNRNYVELIREIESLPLEEQPPYVPLLAYAGFVEGRPGAVEKARETVPLSETSADRVKYLHFVLDVAEGQFRNEKEGGLEESLNAFAASPDSAIALEAFLALTSRAQQRGDSVRMENYLQKAAEINPEFALERLGDFYARINRWEDAANAFEKVSFFGLKAEAVIAYAESLYQLREVEKLKTLSPVFSRGGKNALRTGFYIEALVAAAQNRWEDAAKQLKILDGGIRTPVSLSLMVEVGVRAVDPELVLQGLRILENRPDLQYLRNTAESQIFPLLLTLYTQERIADAAPIAETIRGNIRASNLLLERIVLIDRARKNILLRQELETALRNFPNDSVLLNLAVNAASRDGDFKAMLKWAEQSLALGENAEKSFRQAMAFEGLGQIEKAAGTLAEARERYANDLPLFKYQVAFAIRRHHAATVKGIRAILPDSDSEFKIIAALLDAEEAYQIQDTARMIHLLTADTLAGTLDPVRKEDRELLYHMALRLGGVDVLEPAITIYRKLKPVLPNPFMVQLNLSELYAAAHRPKEALEEAETAYLNNLSVPVAKVCYAIRLSESGRFEEALRRIDELSASKFSDSRLEQARRAALAARIVSRLKNRDYEKCMEDCQTLLTVAPNHQIALDAQEKCKNALEEEKTKVEKQ